jgi:hypothetical protein
MTITTADDQEIFVPAGRPVLRFVGVLAAIALVLAAIAIFKPGPRRPLFEAGDSFETNIDPQVNLGAAVGRMRNPHSFTVRVTLLDYNIRGVAAITAFGQQRRASMHDAKRMAFEIRPLVLPPHSDTPFALRFAPDCPHSPFVGGFGATDDMTRPAYKRSWIRYRGSGDGRHETIRVYRAADLVMPCGGLEGSPAWPKT